MTAINFNARTVSPSETFEPVPPGWYPVSIIESEEKPTSNGAGSYLYLVMRIMDGPYAGRKLFDRLNTNNQNQQTVEIANRTLSAICHATGILDLQDTQQLHGIVIEARATVREAQTGADGRRYDAQNEVKGYRALGSGGAPAPTASMPAAQPAPVPTANFVKHAAAPAAVAAKSSTAPASPPWLKK